MNDRRETGKEEGDGRRASTDGGGNERVRVEVEGVDRRDRTTAGRRRNGRANDMVWAMVEVERQAGEKEADQVSSVALLKWPGR